MSEPSSPTLSVDPGHTPPRPVADEDNELLQHVLSHSRARPVLAAPAAPENRQPTPGSSGTADPRHPLDEPERLALRGVLGKNYGQVTVPLGKSIKETGKMHARLATLHARSSHLHTRLGEAQNQMEGTVKASILNLHGLQTHARKVDEVFKQSAKATGISGKEIDLLARDSRQIHDGLKSITSLLLQQFQRIIATPPQDRLRGLLEAHYEELAERLQGSFNKLVSFQTTVSRLQDQCVALDKQIEKGQAQLAEGTSGVSLLNLQPLQAMASALHQQIKSIARQNDSMLDALAKITSESAALDVDLRGLAASMQAHITENSGMGTEPPPEDGQAAG